METLPYRMQSRRRFLGKSVLGLIGLLATHDKLFATRSAVPSREHPFLFFSHDDLQRIRQNTRLPYLREYWESLLNADIKSDTKFLKEEFDIHNHVAHLLRANEILKRSAFVALIGENREHEDLARLTIEKILSFNEWDYFLEGGTETIGLQRAPETTMSMSFAYDWLADRLSSSDRAAMLDAIARKGIPPCYLTLYGMKYPDRVKGWGFNETTTYKWRFDLSRWPIILDRTNLKMIPIAGLTIGSVLIGDQHQNSEKWLEMAKDSLRKFSTLFGKDGSYLEGVSYWYYTTQHFAMAVEVLKRGGKENLTDLINFPGTMRYALQMQMPSKNYQDDIVNFSDASASTDMSVGFWVAHGFKDGVAQYTSERFGVRRNLFAVIWCDPSIKAEDPPKSLNDVRFENDWVVSRSGWGIDDTVVAMRSGGPSNHEHADRNSVIVKAYGERLLHDPYSASYSHTEKHWLLRLTEAHTAVLIDGKGHQYHDGSEGTNPSKAEAHIVQYEPGEKLTVVTSDATPAYNLVNPDIKKVQRTVVFVKPDVVLFIDEFQKEKAPSTFQVRFQAFNAEGGAKVSILEDGQSFGIIRPSAMLAATVKSDADLKMTTGVLDVPQDKGVFPFVEVASRSLKKGVILTACILSPFPTQGSYKAQIDRSENGYRISFVGVKNPATLAVTFGERFPAVQLL